MQQGTRSTAAPETVSISIEQFGITLTLSVSPDAEALLHLFEEQPPLSLVRAPTFERNTALVRQAVDEAHLPLHRAYRELLESVGSSYVCSLIVEGFARVARQPKLRKPRKPKPRRRA